MDDQRFDQRIKDLLEGFPEPGFDPIVLADLRYRLASVTAVPWYVRYRTELLVVSALLLFTLVNLGWQARLTNERQQRLTAAVDSLNVNQRSAADWQRQLATQRQTILDSLTRAKPSSPPITPAIPTEKDILAVLLERLHQDDPAAWTLLRQVATLLQPDLPSEGSTTQTPGAVPPYLSNLTPSANDHHPTGPGPTPAPSPVATRKRSPAQEKRLSAATARALERHFHRGIGLRLGPAARLSALRYPTGPPTISIGGGLVADWILSPSLSVETGVLYTLRRFEQEAAGELRNLPGVDESLGQLTEVDINSQALEFPLNLKGYVPLSDRTDGVVSGGYTLLLYLRQDLEYSYRLDDDAEGSTRAFKSVSEQSQARFYPGMVNAAAGISTRLRNEARLEVTLRYQHGRGATGIEQARASAFGIRTAYWFTAR